MSTDNKSRKLVITFTGLYGEGNLPLLVVDNWDGSEDQAELIIAWYIASHKGYTRYDLDWLAVESASFASTPEEIGAL